MTAPMDVYNCSFVNLTTTAATSVFLNLGNFANHTAENYLLHEPNAGNTPDIPVSLATSVPDFVPRTLGERVSVEKALHVIGQPDPLIVGSSTDVIGTGEHILGASLHPEHRRSE